MDWTQRWGIDGDMKQIERELGLIPGRYSFARTSQTVTLQDPIYPKQSQTFSIEVLSDEVSGKSWQYGLNEITNGVYALIYRANESTLL